MVRHRLGVPVLYGMLAANAGLGCSPSTSVILISVDTLRADALTAYGARTGHTPNIDRLGNGGTVFSQISAQVPLTLPSHASLLTSTYPFANGITDNGQQLSSNIPTLAAVMKGCGYRTAAFVGGFVMDRRFGLNQGFDLYDSPFDVHRIAGVDPGDVKRAGADVSAAATRWLQQNSAVPTFLFLHLYDLHTPRSRGYASELEYVDGVLGNFFSYLTRVHLLQKSLVIFTSDHGESLGDHGETTHGYFIYQSTLHVPLIIHWPEHAPAFKSRVDEPGSLLDVTPTILQAVGIPPAPTMQGHSLKGANREVYSENHYAETHFGCSFISALRVGRYKYIDAPKPELYDLIADPREQQNVYIGKNSIAKSLCQRLTSLRNRLPKEHLSASAKPTPETIAALRSLGYLAGGAAPLRRSRNKPDPKDRIADYEEYGRAIALASSGNLEQADRELVTLISKVPEASDVRIALGVNQQRLGYHTEAVESFRRVLAHDPGNALAHFDLAVSLFKLQRLNEAAAEARVAITISPSYARAQELQGNIYLEQRDYAGARRAFERLLTIDPDDYAAHYNLGILSAKDRNWNQAEDQLRAASRIDKNAAEVYSALGGIDLQRGDLSAAANALQEAIRLRPRFGVAHYNLGLVFVKQEKKAEAASEFREALKADPQFAPARTALDRLARSPE